jgi:[ribosomal protein S5]-alanine N-acetyltransferase
MISLETERLILRDWRESDLLPFSDMNKDPEVMEFFPCILSPEETALLYRKITDFIKEYGFGLFAVESKQTQQFVGFIGFSQPTFTSFFTPCVEIGWRLVRQSWNQGLATEGAKACLMHGFSALGFKEIYSWTAKVNTKSINVMKKIGLEYRGEFEHPNVAIGHRLRRHVLYRVSNNEFLNK